uniref:Uncharacterized protein n=1 Tax=Anguilla anguilla TaxID=7936 RepID=A0A0E9V474_ANGAN
MISLAFSELRGSFCDSFMHSHFNNIKSNKNKIAEIRKL